MFEVMMKSGDDDDDDDKSSLYVIPEIKLSTIYLST